MTEAEWLLSDDLDVLMRPIWLSKRGAQRNLRLFALACCRCCSAWLPSPLFRTAVEEAERFAERLVDERSLVEFRQILAPLERELRAEAEATSILPNPQAALYHTARAITDALRIDRPGDAYAFWIDQVAIHTALATAYAAMPAGSGAAEESWKVVNDQTYRALTRFAHEIFGNPFRPVAFDSAWRTSDVMLLASGIYAEKAFDRMPILADALQDAGCDSDALLSHLRDPHAPHVRGCWALDLVLGKE